VTLNIISHQLKNGDMIYYSQNSTCCVTSRHDKHDMSMSCESWRAVSRLLYSMCDTGGTTFSYTKMHSGIHTLEGDLHQLLPSLRIVDHNVCLLFGVCVCLFIEFSSLWHGLWQFFGTEHS